MELVLLLVVPVIAGCDVQNGAALQVPHSSFIVIAASVEARKAATESGATRQEAASPSMERLLRQTYGAGVAVGLKGRTCYLVTANHVVDGVGKIRVALWDSEISTASEKLATTIWQDAELDAALLEVDSPDDCYPAALNSFPLRLTQEIRILGQADDHRGAITHGILSAVWNLSPWGLTYITDAAAMKGFSGSGVYTQSGLLTGIVVERAKDPNIGLSFIVPICAILKEIPQRLGINNCQRQ